MSESPQLVASADAPVLLSAMADGGVAILTLGIAIYAAAVLVGVGMGINAARTGRRRLAIGCAVAVGILTVVGVVVAVLSSV